MGVRILFSLLGDICEAVGIGNIAVRGCAYYLPRSGNICGVVGIWPIGVGVACCFPRYKAGEIIAMDRVQECVDGPRLLRMRLGELVPHSLGWNCALGVGVWHLSPRCTR